MSYNKPLLADLMESLLFLQEEGWLNKSQIKTILLEKYNVYEIVLLKNKMICHQEGIITTVEI